MYFKKSGELGREGDREELMHVIRNVYLNFYRKW